MKSWLSQEISRNSQGNTCVGASVLMKLQASGLRHIKKETPKMAFSSKFCKILRTFFLQNTSGRLLPKSEDLPCKSHVHFSLSLIQMEKKLENMITAKFQEIKTFDKYSAWNSLMRCFQPPQKVNGDYKKKCTSTQSSFLWFHRFILA